VSVRTGMFNADEAKYANDILVELPYSTNDVRLLSDTTGGDRISSTKDWRLRSLKKSSIQCPGSVDPLHTAPTVFDAPCL
jgi:hypothetical protein